MAVFPPSPLLPSLSLSTHIDIYPARLLSSFLITQLTPLTTSPSSNPPTSHSSPLLPWLTTYVFPSLISLPHPSSSPTLTLEWCRHRRWLSIWYWLTVSQKHHWWAYLTSTPSSLHYFHFFILYLLDWQHWLHLFFYSLSCLFLFKTVFCLNFMIDVTWWYFVFFLLEKPVVDRI